MSDTPTLAETLAKMAETLETHTQSIANVASNSAAQVSTIQNDLNVVKSVVVDLGKTVADIQTGNIPTAVEDGATTVADILPRLEAVEKKLFGL